MSAAPTQSVPLWIPKTPEHGFRAARRFFESQLLDQPKKKEHPGRPMGMPHGSWVSELVERKKAIWFCFSCNHRFGDAKRQGYYRDRKFPFVIGNCDACKDPMARSVLYIHESYLADPSGIRNGQCWTPR